MLPQTEFREEVSLEGIRDQVMSARDVVNVRFRERLFVCGRSPLVCFIPEPGMRNQAGRLFSERYTVRDALDPLNEVEGLLKET